MVSRSEGYRRSAGKEPVALAIVQEFFRVVVDVQLDLITDRDDNFHLGDLRSPAGITMECKGQPIDPLRYPKNFVEVFEETHRLEHAGGFREVAQLLDLAPERLAAVNVLLPSRQTVALGWVPNVSVSIHSFFNSPLTTYVNYYDGGKWIYVYDRAELTGHLKTAVPRGLLRGAGKSNEDTFAVKVRVADKRWQRVGGKWRWAGTGESGAAVTHLRALLSGEVGAL